MKPSINIQWIATDNKWSQRMAWFCYGFFLAAAIGLIIQVSV